jgi:hypothetical protein
MRIAAALLFCLTVLTGCEQFGCGAATQERYFSKEINVVKFEDVMKLANEQCAKVGMKARHIRFDCVPKWCGAAPQGQYPMAQFQGAMNAANEQCAKDGMKVRHVQFDCSHSAPLLPLRAQH